MKQTINSGQRIIHKGKEFEVAVVLDPDRKEGRVNISVHPLFRGNVRRNTTVCIFDDWEYKNEKSTFIQ